METTYCQSCGMPLIDEAMMGSDADGSQNRDYCQYCYQAGKFTADMTMDQMIEVCVPYMVEGNPDMTPEKARASMQSFFPMLKRWKSA